MQDSTLVLEHPVSQRCISEMRVPQSISQVDMLAHILRIKTLDLPPHIHSMLWDPVFVGLDAEWFERGSRPLTELGIATVPYFSRGADPFSVLRNMIVSHTRIRKNAHMVNSKWCAGHPEKFEFGETRFVTMEEGRELLMKSFEWHNQDGHRRPVVFIGHAVDNDIEAMRKHMQVDLEAQGGIVLTLDTQIMARQFQFAAGRKLSLTSILHEFGISERFLHNAGNDAALTMVAAFLLAHERIHPNRYRGYHENQEAVNQIKQHLRASRNDFCVPSYGISTFCTRCDGTNHFASRCRSKVWCEKCGQNTRYSNAAHTHKTEKCGLNHQLPSKGVVVQCTFCINSHNWKRSSNANTHTDSECYFL